MAVDPEAEREPKNTTYQENFKQMKPKRTKKKVFASTRASKLITDDFDQAIESLTN